MSKAANAPRGGRAGVMGLDRFPVPSVRILHDQHVLISALLEQNRDHEDYHSLELKASDAGRQIAACGAAATRELLRAMLARVLHLDAQANQIRAKAKDKANVHFEK